MTMTTLTLTAPREIIALAEEQAKADNTTIDAVIINLIIENFKQTRRAIAPPIIGPITQSLSGIVTLPDDFNEKDFMGDILAEKYSSGK